VFLLVSSFRGWRLVALISLILPVLAACSGGDVGHSGVKRAAFTSKEFGVNVSPRVTKAKYPPRGGGRELPLKPYTVRGVTYQPVAGPGYVETGMASWYGQDFHGRRTANGEVFGAYYLTAASPVLPIPSYARVTNLENGRSVMVRVNDRGPYMSVIRPPRFSAIARRAAPASKCAMSDRLPSMATTTRCCWPQSTS
jgi:rare lipoprotein A